MSEPAAPAPPARRGRGQQTVLDMLRSLALILVAVGALVLIVPRPDKPIRQPVDVAQAADAAQEAGAPAVVPHVPDGWSATSARYEPRGADGVPTFHVGYLTPSETYAGLEVARGATDAWLRQQTSQGEVTGSQDVDGQSWQQRLSSDGKRRSLVHETRGVTVVVTGTASLEELAQLASSAELG
jgi:hypothetical protein